MPAATNMAVYVVVRQRSTTPFYFTDFTLGHVTLSNQPRGSSRRNHTLYAVISNNDNANHSKLNSVKCTSSAKLYAIHFVLCDQQKWNKPCGRPPQYAPPPCKLTFDLKMVSESRVTWATSVPILVFLDLSVLDLGPMYATDRQTSDAHHRLMPPPYGGGA